MAKIKKKTSDHKVPVGLLPYGEVPFEVHTFYRDSFILHGHHYFEVMLITRSGGKHILDGKLHIMKKRDVYFLGPYHIHSARADHGKLPMHINVSFFPELLGPEKGDAYEIVYRLFYSLGEVRPISLPIADFHNCLSICSAMKRIHNSQSPFRDDVFSALLKSLLLIVVSVAEPPKGPYDLRIAKILQYLNAHFKDKIETRTLAGMVQLTSSRFAQIFKKVMGRTVKEVLLRLRLNVAKRLFSLTSMNVKQVMKESGFNNYGYFRRTFHRLTGMTWSSIRLKSRVS